MVDKLIWIAIDGPAGSGKSTIAKQLQKNYLQDFVYINTGAMYRALAYFFKINNINIDSQVARQSVLNKICINLINDNVYVEFDDKSIDATPFIYNEEIAKLTSKISTFEDVRKKLVSDQQKIASNHNVIMDGRDIGTVVLPNATLKIYLDASIHERARRRYLQLNKLEISLQNLEQEIHERDTMDKSRAIGALQKAQDAILISTDNLSIDECCQKILDCLHLKLN